MDTQQQISLNVLLIGESCIDEYHYGTCNRISPEAPVPILDFLHKDSKIGMAGNVNQNLESFGVTVDFLTNDKNLLIKRRFVDVKSYQQILREDIENKVSPVVFEGTKKYDAIIFSDYDKGFITPEFAYSICNNNNTPIFVDTKKKDVSCFPNSFIKINQYEEESITKYDSSSEFIVTMGRDGARLKDKLFSAPNVEVFDVTGAGDVFLSSLCYFYITTFDIQDSIQKSIKLASKSVRHIGTYKLTKEDINEVCN